MAVKYYSAFVSVRFCQTWGQMGSEGCFKSKVLNIPKQNKSMFMHATLHFLSMSCNLCRYNLKVDKYYSHCKKRPKSNWHPTNQPTLACIDQRQVRIDLFVSGLYMCSRDIEVRILNPYLGYHSLQNH